jgi:hypothetical protein
MRWNATQTRQCILHTAVFLIHIKPQAILYRNWPIQPDNCQETLLKCDCALHSTNAHKSLALQTLVQIFGLSAVCLVGCSCLSYQRSEDYTELVTNTPVLRALSSLQWLEVCTKTEPHNQYVGTLAWWYIGCTICTNFTQALWRKITS